jgi:predicted DNA-binding protein (MmcQ/YjbR family)
MTIENIQSICRQWPGVTESVKLTEHYCIDVGGKTFLWLSPDSVPISASVKVPAEDFEQIISREGFSPQAYVARYKWVYIDDINRLSIKEWEFYLRQSYTLIAEKLPAKIKKELGLQKSLS